jgi:DNA topoisomerase I
MNTSPRLELIVDVSDPILTAKAIGLRYVSDTERGFQRKRAGKHFSYLGLDGKPIRDREHLKRIKSLAIPPAWSCVWICTLANGHIQATGRDAKGRKQYRYHPLWGELSSQTKFQRTIAFGEALPRIREMTQRALNRRGLPREKVLAAVIQLLDKTYIRIGNEEYVRANQSYGLTTLREEHVDVSGGSLRFQFRGKSGQMHAIDVQDRRLARVVKRCQDLPGEELFRYVDHDGQAQKIGSADVNDYLREITGQDFTAKHFRTWAGTVEASLALRELGEAATKTAAKRSICQAIRMAAQRLGNKPATCRKYYVHPAILEAYTDGVVLGAIEQQQSYPHEVSAYGLRPEEQAVLQLLKTYDSARKLQVSEASAA